MWLMFLSPRNAAGAVWVNFCVIYVASRPQQLWGSEALDGRVQPVFLFLFFLEEASFGSFREEHSQFWDVKLAGELEPMATHKKWMGLTWLSLKSSIEQF